MLPLLAACADAAPTGMDAGPVPVQWVSLGDGGCGARARRVPTLPGVHVDPDAGTPVWLTNPPSSGPHFPVWTHWGAWTGVPRGNWVHNLEHGGVALLYRCDGPECEARRAALVAVMNALPTDPTCLPPVRVRVVVTDDRDIVTPVAAAAWGAVYEAQCVDEPSLRAFYAMFPRHAPEDLCADGAYP